MGKLGTSRLHLGIASLVVGIALTTLSRLAHGFLGGLLIGMGLTLILASVFALGRTMRDGGGWLPSRDGQPDAHPRSARDR